MEVSLLENLEIIAITLGIAGVIIAPILGWIRSKFKCIGEVKTAVDKADERSLRQSKGLIILSYRIDAINFDQHKKKLNLGPEMETILKDEKGDL